MAHLQIYADHFANELYDEAILGVAYEIHRTLTKGTLFLDESDSKEDDGKYKIVVESGLDVFGQAIGGSKKNVECLCPTCSRPIAACRFAPHLEKCMGMGRNSSRIASQRIANSGKSISDSVGADNDLGVVKDTRSGLLTEETLSKKSRKRQSGNDSPQTAKPLNVRSKKLRNPRAGQSSRSGVKMQLRTVDQNKGTSDITPSLPKSTDNNYISNQNVNQTLSLWQEHINATLSGQDSNVESKILKVGLGSSGVPEKKSLRKRTKHN